jgi:hypothetical protein
VGWLRPVARAVWAAASLGGLASLYVTLAGWSGRYQKMADHPGVFLLFVGIFIVWFPTVILLRQMTRGVMARDSLKLVLRHASPLVRRSVWSAWIYCGIVWAGSMIVSLVGKNKAIANEVIYFSAFMMVFYATAVGVSAAALAMTPEQIDPHCVNGHQVGVDAKFCQSCGARVVGAESSGA